MAGYKTDITCAASLPSSQVYQYAVGIALDVHDFPKHHRREVKLQEEDDFIAKADSS
jgi:hypothetical protein